MRYIIKFNIVIFIYVFFVNFYYSQSHKEKFALKQKLDNYYYSTQKAYVEGNYDEALEESLKALNIARKLYAKNDSSIIVFYYTTGNIYQKLEKNDKAIEYFNKVININNKIKSNKDLELIANVYGNLGAAHQTKKDYDKALKFYKKAYNIYTKKLDKNKYKQSISIISNHISYAQQKKGDYKSSIGSHFKTLKLKIEEHGNEHSEVAMIYHSLGDIYKINGEYDNAKKNYLKALGIYENLKEYQESVAKILDNIGGVYQHIGEYMNAIESYENAINIYTNKLDKNHYQESIATIYNNLGSVYAQKEDYKTAHKYYKEALKICQLNKNKTLLASLYNNLGSYYYQNKKFQEAIQHFVWAIRIDGKTLVY